MYYFYILRCRDGTLYCGQTNDLEKRTASHNAGKGAKYTRGRRPVKLVYFEKYRSLRQAMKREWQVKKWPKAEKAELIKNWNKII